jgi:RecG-like helicase
MNNTNSIYNNALRKMFQNSIYGSIINTHNFYNIPHYNNRVYTKLYGINVKASNVYKINNKMGEVRFINSAWIEDNIDEYISDYYDSLSFRTRGEAEIFKLKDAIRKLNLILKQFKTKKASNKYDRKEKFKFNGYHGKNRTLMSTLKVIEYQTKIDTLLDELKNIDTNHPEWFI